MSPSADWLDRYPEVGPGILTPGMDAIRKSSPIADSVSMFTQLRAGNMSLPVGTFGGVSLAEANRMPLLAARLLLDADMTASSNDALFTSLTYARINNASAFASMVYRNSMSLIVIKQAAKVSSCTAQYNRVVRDTEAAGNNDKITNVHNEYTSSNGAAGTIDDMYFTRNEASWGGTSAEIVTNFYGWHMEDLTSYVTAGRITNLWNIYAVAGNSAFGGKVRVGALTAPSESVSLGAASSATGTLGFYHASSALATILRAGNATAAVTYTLPTAGPSVNGAALTSTTAGVMSWSAAAMPLSSEPYVTIGNTSGLSAERALTGTTNQITVTDNGANSTVVLSTPQDIHTGATPEFLRIGIGKAADASIPVDVLGSSINIGTNRTNNTTKNGVLLVPHYANATAPVALILGANTSGTNQVSVGGNAGANTAATVLAFFTATTDTTLGGVEAARFDSTGDFGIGTTAPDSILHVKSRTSGTDLIVHFEGFGISASQIQYSTNGSVRWLAGVPSASSNYSLVTGGSTRLSLDSTGVMTVANEVRIGGDTGGAASHVTITNTVSGVSTGVGTVLMNGTTARSSTGWLKVYSGTSARFIPFWTTITG